MQCMAHVLSGGPCEDVLLGDHRLEMLGSLFLGCPNHMGSEGTHGIVDELCAELTAFIPGRELDDDGNVLIRYKSGAKGILYASQISNGDENALSIRVYGTKASLEWHQEDPNELIIKYADKPRQILRRGNDYLGKAAQNNSRTPFAHPEGFIEAFANVYLAAADAISDEVSGKRLKKSYDFPNIDDGIYGMAFIESVVKSSNSKTKWTKFPKL